MNEFFPGDFKLKFVSLITPDIFEQKCLEFSPTKWEALSTTIHRACILDISTL